MLANKIQDEELRKYMCGRVLTVIMLVSNASLCQEHPLVSHNPQRDELPWD